MRPKYQLNNYYSKYDKMRLSHIREFIPMMETQKVSQIARSKSGFLSRLIETEGDYDMMGYTPSNDSMKWMHRRENFIKRNLAKVEKTEERMFDVSGLPTRRTLSLYAWGYDPSPRDTRKARIIQKMNRKKNA
jgi:hypothetical protein